GGEIEGPRLRQDDLEDRHGGPRLRPVGMASQRHDRRRPHLQEGAHRRRGRRSLQGRGKIMRTLLTFLFVVLAPQVQDKWEAEIKKFEEADKTSPPPENGIVFVGSSSIRLWKTKEAFPDLPVINRGFGGSEMGDAARFAERIVIAYKPRIVIAFAGGNDIHGGKIPEQVA